MNRFTNAREGVLVRSVGSVGHVAGNDGVVGVDVHQHLWPVELVEELRRRTQPPFLRGWTLHTATEAPFEVDPDDHDPALRAAQETGRALVSLSTPLGIEALPATEASPLLAAWHAGAAQLPSPFGAWAAAHEREPDLDALKGVLTDGFVGLQIGAHQLATPAAIEAAGPVLRLVEQLGSPVLVHPGPAGTPPGDVPGWWPALVDYPAALHAAWWSWHAAGRAMFPALRLCFVAGAGLAPLHHERFAARSGERFIVDHDVFVDTSSYGRQGIDALTRALGIDVVVLGSDRPYAQPPDPGRLDLGAAAWHAINVVNPSRLLEGERT